MLETDDVDDDFFTPVAGTSLAKIFGKTSLSSEDTQNDSLKYIPTKLQDPCNKEPKYRTQCIKVWVVTVHQWLHTCYIPRGKLGLAITKVLKTDEHELVIYNNDKEVFTKTPLTSKLEVTIHNNSYISYYDKDEIYWSIHASHHKIKTIAEALKSWEVKISYSTYEKEGPPDPFAGIETVEYGDRHEEQKKESDINSKKTKASIVNRMANMGHSVLPVKAPTSDSSSDSSDKVEAVRRTFRHKPIKTSSKKTNVEKVCESQNLAEEHETITGSNMETDKHVAVYNSELMPLTNTSIIAGTSSELRTYMSEQRVTNTETRLAMNRITDKMDLVLNKINHLEYKERDTNVSTEIMLKLLTEYEDKIKRYEDLFKTINDGKNTHDDISKLSRKDEVETLKNKIFNLQKENLEKSNEITNLRREMKLLKDSYSNENEAQTRKISDLHLKINILEEDLENKSKELIDLGIYANTKINNDNIEEKVKNIMNNTFQTISMNFESDKHYSGENVKRMIGVVLKKMTIQAFNQL